MWWLLEPRVCMDNWAVSYQTGFKMCWISLFQSHVHSCFIFPLNYQVGIWPCKIHYLSTHYFFFFSFCLIVWLFFIITVLSTLVCMIFPSSLFNTHLNKCLGYGCHNHCWVWSFSGMDGFFCTFVWLVWFWFGICVAVVVVFLFFKILFPINRRSINALPQQTSDSGTCFSIKGVHIWKG